MTLSPNPLTSVLILVSQSGPELIFPSSEFACWDWLLFLRSAKYRETIRQRRRMEGRRTQAALCRLVSWLPCLLFPLNSADWKQSSVNHGCGGDKRHLRIPAILPLLTLLGAAAERLITHVLPYPRRRWSESVFWIHFFKNHSQECWFAFQQDFVPLSLLTISQKDNFVLPGLSDLNVT